jgi:hypothetical protein
MSKAQDFLLLFCEGHTVTVALHDLGSSAGGKADLYVNTDIFGFELWDVPSEDPIVADNRVAKNYVGLFNNLTVIDKKEIRKYNSTKQRISLERSKVEKVFIPDRIWVRLSIPKPSADQKLFMQCLYLLFRDFKVRIVGMSDQFKIDRLW